MREKGIWPLPLTAAKVTDPFWLRTMELVRTEVIPYQWEALNDRVPNAAPSWWMHNMRAAARAVAARRTGRYEPFRQEGKGIEFLPGDRSKADPDRFYGFVFQDSDGYKWLEAVSYTLMRCPDPTLQATAQEAVDAICAAQEDDGYLDTYYTLTGIERRFTNLRDHHELYCLGHLIEAAVAWHQATGQEDLLNAAIRFADCVAAEIGPEKGKKRGYPGHEIAEMALVRLWQETGEERFLKQACYFVDERGQSPNYFAEEDAERRRAAGQEPEFSRNDRYAYYQAHKPVREQEEAVGHAVRDMYLFSGVADTARLTGDSALVHACRRVWHSAVEEKMYITGGVGSTHVGEAFSRPYDLPADTAYSETCASVALAFFARRMLQLEADSSYADAMERALYNTVLAGMALDGKSFFYVNPLEVDPDACRTDARLSHVKPVRQKWFGCACCPPNIARLVASIPAYAWTVSEDTLYTHLYVAGELDITLNGSPLRLKIDSDLPWRGEVKVTVLSGIADGTLAFRIPAWCCGEAAFDHRADLVRQEGKGYVCLTGTWRKGDEIGISLPMPVCAVAASPLVQETAGMVAFTRGPVVYCAEEKDNGKLLHLLHIDPKEAALKAETVEKVIAGTSVTVIVTPAMREHAPGEGAALYRKWRPARYEETTLTLVPYFAWNNRGEGEMRVWIRTV